MSLSSSSLKPAFYGLLILLAVLAPLYVTNAYHLHILIVVGIVTVAALGVRMVISIGQWSFGQAGMMAVGAYITVMLVVHSHLNFWIAFPIAGLGTMVVAYVLGYPALKLKGAYFSILTLTFGVVIKQLIMLNELRPWTGGAVGIYNIPPPHRFFIVDFSASKVPYYYFIFAILFATISVMYLMERSRLGKTFAAIRQGDTLAESVGVDITRYKVLAFVVASMLTGLVGAFSAHYYLLVHPENYRMWDSIYFVAYATIVCGTRYTSSLMLPSLCGTGSLFGPVLGSLVLVVAVELVRRFAEYQSIAYALLLLIVIMFLPRGAISLPEVVLSWARSVNWARISRIPLALRGRRVEAGDE